MNRVFPIVNDESPTPAKKLSDFKPLKRLVLPNLGELDASGLTIFVGPNSSGKTQLLRDIRYRTTGEVRELVVATELDVESPDFDEFIACLKAEGHIFSTYDDNEREQFVSRTVFAGTGQASKNVQSTDASQWHQNSKSWTGKRRKDQYFGWAATYLVTALFLDNRLTAVNSVGVIEFEKAPPQHDLHALHVDDDARKTLADEAIRAFSKAVWTDISQGQLCLRIGQDGVLPSAEDRLSARKMSNYRTIMEEGDGMKSYVATCISVLLGRRPVCLIDEPELCLHPPQAYNLGQFIGKRGTSKQTATFVATHSSHVLRGVIQTADKLKIVRLTNSPNGFRAKQVDSGVLAQAMKKPTVRAETVLDGIFSQAVAIVEADGDRIVYQAAWDAVGAEMNFDIHFATVGGLGGIADTCDLYQVLGIPVSVIADLDVVSDKAKFKKIVSSLIDDDEIIKGFTERVQALIDLIRHMPPSISEDDTRAKLDELRTSELDWGKATDTTLRFELNSLSGKLYRMRALKEGGLDDLPESVAIPLGQLVSDLRQIGLFLVPVGELEWWLKNCGILASKKKKWAWANEAATYIRDNDALEDDVWSFVASVGAYLTDQVH